MGSGSCSLWMLVARTDIPYMMYTIPHLVRMCNFPFSERVLAVDNGELAGDYRQRPGIGTIAELRDCCDRLLSAGVVDKIVDIDFSAAYRDRVCRKHFQGHVEETHDYRGAPIIGYIFCIEEAKSDYMLYFDCDMLLYQAGGFSWIEAGIELLQKNNDVVVVMPRVSPPRKEEMSEKSVAEKPNTGNFKQGFTSRRFLIDRKRFDKLLPLETKWLPSGKKRKWLPDGIQRYVSSLTGRGGLERWEKMVSSRMKATSYYRADLTTDKAWTVHPKDHGQNFIQALPSIIERVEGGGYPEEQAGYYDLQLKYWL